MGIYFKILHLLCFVSIAVSFGLVPHLKDFKLKLADELKTHRPNNANPLHPKRPSTDSQCVCIPTKPGGQLVTDHLGLTDQSIERLVVYLYKQNGELKAFIPNKQKQIYIPDLHFDQNDGDILISASSISIAQLITDSPIIRYKVPAPGGVVVEDSEPIIRPTPKPEQPDNGGTWSIPDKILPDNSQSVPNSKVQIKILYPMLKNILNLDSPEQLQQIFLTLSPETQAYLLSLIPQLKVPQNPSQGRIVQFELKALYQFLLKLLNSGNVQHVYRIFSLLPAEIQLQLKVLLPQLKITHTESSKGQLTFNAWFLDQLKRVVFYNLESSSQVTELKRRVINVFVNNGMRLNNGVVINSSGKVLKLSNIKLRPILVGDAQVFNQQRPGDLQGNPADVSYLQVILLSYINPPKVFGAIPMGRVYLSKISANHNIKILNSAKSLGGLLVKKIGCPTCQVVKSLTQVPPSIIDGLSSIKGVTYTKIPGVSESYVDLPLRRSDQSEPLPSSVQDADTQLDEKLDEDDSSINDLANTDQNLEAAIDPRILGGSIYGPSKPVGGTKDELPGYRIVGGNAATSSGTPLVSKGRSGYQSFII